jgi:hypothetical protein
VWLQSRSSTDYGVKDIDFRTKSLLLVSSDSLKLFEIFEIILNRFYLGMRCTLLP